MRWQRGFYVTLAVLATVLGAGRAPAAGTKPTTDKAVAMTNAGNVTGHVYDASTSLPLPGARVTIQQDGKFADKGATTAATNDLGLYRCRASLGRVSTSYSIAGLLLGPLAGPGTTRTQRVDITQLPVRVSAPGYRSFEGIVRCRTTSAESFSVTLEPILLTLQDSSEVSTTADGWGSLKLLELTVEPRLLHPGEKAKLTARVQAPAAATAKKKTSFLSAIFGGGRKSPLKLAMVSSLSDRKQGLSFVSNEAGLATFTGEFQAPKKLNSPSVTLYVYVEESPLEILAGTRRKSALLQVLPKGTEEAGARLRLEAASSLELGETAQAQAKLVELCARPEVSIDDCLGLARVSDRLHDSGTQVKATTQALSLLPTDKKKAVFIGGQEMKPEAARWRLVGERARALVANGQMKEVLATVKPELDAVKEKDRPRTIPGSVLIAIGRAYLDSGQVPEAASLRDSLHQYPQALSIPEAGEFASKLRLAQAEQAVQATPQLAGAWAGYGRALLDQGRWEEASTALQTALQKDPSARAVRRDLTYTLLHLQGQSGAVEQSLGGALTAARLQLGLEKGEVRSRNFHDWHAYAMLLYRQGRVQQQAQDPAAAATMVAAREALVEAIKNGREGSDEQNETSYSYSGGYLVGVSSRSINISGFAYPEAAADFILLNCLDTLQTCPDDPLTWHTMSTALLDLQQPETAQEALQECRSKRADFPEATFTQALLALQQQQPAAARQALQTTLEANPRHPRANKLLAELYAEDGDMVNSAACLAAHVQFYGEVE